MIVQRAVRGGRPGAFPRRFPRFAEPGRGNLQVMADGTDGFPSRYEGPRHVATGGMGEIFVARDTTLGRTVAIKRLSERFARDESVRRRFTREGLAAARLSGHPNIVTSFDVGESSGRPFLVMEHLTGGTVAERARAGDVPHEQALAWLRQSADALEEAHANGIVHRDVKPANLLLDDRGDVRVADFGVARIVEEGATHMTIAGTVLGTAGYLSPEQARGEPATPASDVYSLGVVAYELLTGGRPFEGGSATEEAARHIHQPVPPASERGVGLPRSVDRVFERVLAKDPGERYATPGAFVSDLAAALDESERTQVLPPPVAAPPTAATRRMTRDREPAPARRGGRAWLPLVAGIALVAALLGGVVFAATLGNDDDDPGAEQAQTEPREVTVTTVQEGTTVERTVTEEAPAPPPPPPPTPTPPPQGGGNVSMAEARQLTDQAKFAMDAGDYEEAVALAERALTRLGDTGDIYEAYAAYNAGNSYAELGNCERALALLERSEAVQGERSEIDAARAKCS